jgi:hypothetical protein
VRLSDLATHAEQPPPDPGLRRQPEDTWSGPGAAVAMLTAKLANQNVSHAQLADGIPPEFIMSALAVPGVV